jgi:hypothetical protein
MPSRVRSGLRARRPSIWHVSELRSRSIGPCNWLGPICSSPCCPALPALKTDRTGADEASALLPGQRVEGHDRLAQRPGAAQAQHLVSEWCLDVTAAVHIVPVRSCVRRDLVHTAFPLDEAPRGGQVFAVVCGIGSDTRSRRRARGPLPRCLVCRGALANDGCHRGVGELRRPRDAVVAAASGGLRHQLAQRPVGVGELSAPVVRRGARR